MSNHSAHRALQKLLVRLGLITHADEGTPEKFENFFPIAFYAKQNRYSEETALSQVAQSLGIKLITLNATKADKCIELLSTPKLSRIKIERWKSLRFIPVGYDDAKLLVAAANPLDREAVQSLEFELGEKIQLILAREDEILAVLAKRLNSTRNLEVGELLLHASADQLQISTQEEMRLQESDVSAVEISAAPVVLLVNKIFSDAVDAHASDIHLNPEKEGIEAKMRVDGVLRPLVHVPLPLQAAVISRIKLLAGMDIAERRRPQDGRLRIKTSVGTKDLRLSTVPAVFGENMVIRILSSDLPNLTLSALGVYDETLTLFSRALKESSRVILVTGPTGSGKTSTLYSMLLMLRDGKRNIMSIEDPIEYRIPGIAQIQVNPKIGVTFAEGLRSVLRQDPDVVMVGEIRDAETATIAMQTAQTGHLVLSTIHTNSAAAAVTRLEDLGVPRHIISSAIGALVAQRLVRKLCGECKVLEESVPKHVLRNLQVAADKCYRAQGCPSCEGLGYKGRIAIYSFLPVNDTIRELIRSGASEEELERAATPLGFISLKGAAGQAVALGFTSWQEAERAVGDLSSPQQSINLHSQEPVQAPTPLHPGLTKRKILLVEDDDNTRMVLSMLLDREFYEVIEAIDGVDALDKLHASLPEIIICDLMMPRMTGSEFLQRVRLDPRLKHIPILMLTAASTEANEINLIQGGADDFVSKTADSKVMLARVQRLLARSHV